MACMLGINHLIDMQTEHLSVWWNMHGAAVQKRSG
jgi:hypothetical protein